MPSQTPLPGVSRKPSTSTARAAGDLLSGESKRAIVNGLAQGALGQSRVPELSPEHKKAIAGVFTRMKSIYGHLWNSIYRDEDTLKMAHIDWLRAFQAIQATPKEVNLAVNWCAENQDKMPNLPQFIGIIKEQRQEAERQKQRESERAAISAQLEEPPEQRAAREAKAAAAKEERRATALAEIAKIKECLIENR